MTPVKELETSELRSQSEVNASSMVVRFVGSAEVGAKNDLDAYLQQVHETVTSGDIGEVVIDMHNLEFMNSSCFKAFVTWLSLIQELPDERAYKVRFLSSEKRHWQSRSLSALACFAVDLITVESS